AFYCAHGGGDRMSSNASLSGARATLQACATLVSSALEHLARHAGDRGRITDERIDAVQQPVHEIVWCATWLRVADAMLEHASTAGGLEIRWAKACVAEAADEIRTRLGRAPADFGLDAVALNATFASPEVEFFLETALDATTAMELARGLD